MKNKIIFFLLLLTSCSTYHKKSKSYFTYCYDGVYTGLDTLLNLNGFYELELSFYDEKGSLKSSTKRPIVFFSDGSFVYESWLIYMERNGYQQSYPGEYDGYGWGVYKIYNDTIWTQNFAVSSTTSSCRKFVFRVLDKNSIECIFESSNIIDISLKDIEDYLSNKETIKFGKANFVEWENLPCKSYSKIMKKKWFWCDKEAYMKWKNE